MAIYPDEDLLREIQAIIYWIQICGDDSGPRINLAEWEAAIEDIPRWSAPDDPPIPFRIAEHYEFTLPEAASWITDYTDYHRLIRSYPHDSRRHTHKMDQSSYPYRWNHGGVQWHWWNTTMVLEEKIYYLMMLDIENEH